MIAPPVRRPAPPRIRSRAVLCRAARALPLALLLPVVLPARVPAVERVMRLYDERDGLTVAETAELAQDSRGFLWIGTMGGVTRFDGTEMRAWAPHVMRHTIRILSAGPGGEVVMAGIGEPLRRATADSVEAVPGPDGGPVVDWVHAALAGDGALWVATADSLRRRGPEGRWSAWPAGAFGGVPARRVCAAGADSVWVATRDVLWIVGSAGEPRRLAEVAWVRDVARMEDGATVFASEAPGRVWRLDDDGLRMLCERERGTSGFAVRGSTIWACMGTQIVSIPPSGAPRVVAPVPGLPGGRPLLVDREGTLWIGGFRGLLALPEPETVSWNEADGLPTPAHVHHLCRTPDSVWAIAWAGAVRMRLGVEPRRIEPVGSYSGRIRPDPQGRLWGADLDRGFIRWDGDRATRFPFPDLHGVYGTAPRADGSLWISTDDGLFLAPPGEGAPRRVAADPPFDAPNGWTDSWVGPVLEDRRGEIWLGHDEEIWCAGADDLARGRPVEWRREQLPGSEEVIEILELPDGTLWAATNNTGVQERGSDGWHPLPGNDAFESLRVYGMVHAPSGGVWVLMAGTVARVVRRPDLPAGWEVVERLTSWQGLPTQQAGDIHEEPDGRLWLATLAGLVEVPPEARHARAAPPPVELVDVESAGRPLPLGAGVRLPWRRNNLEVRFAALSYRDRNRLRYQVRMRPSEPWREIREPMFRFVDLSPGHYRAEVRASLDGASWTDPPTHLDFAVGKPWWQTAWAIAWFVLAGAAALYAAHRVRIGVLLGLERERVRIAMDLHDEVGSGLGSIGILAGLAAEPAAGDERRRWLAARIAESAGELGSVLGDIVRSLAGSPDTVESFVMRLTSRAHRLVPGERPGLRLVLPAERPTRRLAADLQRQLHAIAVEALHNAVRHANAATIELGLDLSTSPWRLWVADDGCGLPAASPRDAGHGLGNMRARAGAIGATLDVTAGPEGGTRIEVRFDPGHGGARMDVRGRRPTAPGRIGA